MIKMNNNNNNKSKSIRAICSFLIVFLVISILFSVSSYASEISGEIYDLSFDQVKDVVILVNSTPKQQYIAKDAKFSFNLDPGFYQIEFKSYDNNILVAKAYENVSISNSNGVYILDVILLPVLDDVELLYESDNVVLDLGGLDNSSNALANEGSDGKKNNIILYIIVSIVLSIILIAFIFLVWRFLLSKMIRNVEEELEAEDNEEEKGNLDEIKKKVDKEDVITKDDIEKNKASVEQKGQLKEKTTKEENLLDKAKYDEFISVDSDYKKEVLDVIKKENRITQKDLRKNIPLSEAKVSLIIAELYEEGKIKKIKKGRGNILVYNKE